MTVPPLQGIANTHWHSYVSMEELVRIGTLFTFFNLDLIKFKQIHINCGSLKTGHKAECSNMCLAFFKG